MSIASLYPSINPSLLLDFANSKVLDPRITFTRTTTATYYDGVTTAVAEQNLLTYSQEFDNAAWTAQNCTVGANATTAPDGTSTAESIVASNAVNPSSGLYRGTPSATTQSLSFYVKAGNKTFATIITNNSNGGYNAWFNLGTGAVGTKGANITSSAIQSVGNSWYRISIILPYVSGNLGVYFTDADNSLTCTGNGSTVSGYVWGAQLEDRSSLTAYTATTTQAITNYIPVLQTASAGQARFDHNPTTGESLGLLIEEARTNSVTYSSDFSNAAWTKPGITITSNTIIAPDGTLTGDKIIPDATNYVHYIDQGVTTVASTTYAYSAYIKAAGYSTAVIYFISISAPFELCEATINLSTGAISGSGAANGGTFTSASAVDVGNGWWRVVLVGSIGAKTNMAVRIYVNSTSTYTGNGFNGIFLWGAQLEAGSFATSYIPTVASSVTRNADAASMTGTNFSSWWNAAEGTFFSDCTNFSLRGSGALSTILSVLNASNTNEYGMGYVASTGAARGYTYANGAYTSDINAGGSSPSRLAYGIKVNNYGLSQNGSSATTSAGAGVMASDMNRLIIGNDYVAGYELNGRIRKLAYYPIKATSTQLQSLTV